MLSRSTGCRQKTLQARQSACRWITITTCLFIHVFICVFIFSPTARVIKKCWLRQWHADTRKHMLGVEVVSHWRESWRGAGRQRSNWSDCLQCLDGFFFLFRWKQKHRWQRQNQAPTVRGMAEPQELRGRPLIFDWFGLWGPIQPLRWKATVTRKANRHSDIICHLAFPQRGSIAIL